MKESDLYMKLVVGLGNPGSKYDNTRHNIGFSFVDKYLNYQYNSVEWKSKFNGLYFQTNLFSEKVVFLKPQSFMNLSGEVVKKYIDFFKIDISDILIISDDMDLSVGNFKLKEHGSCGGHNGLRNIENCISTSNYKRLRVGISKLQKGDTKDYVLGKFSLEDSNILNNTFGELICVLNDYFVLDFSDLMNKYNRKNR